MKIETKFNVGDAVFVVHENQIREAAVRVIKIKIKDEYCPEKHERLTMPNISYYLRRSDKPEFHLEYEEAEIFTTKDGLLASL